MRFAELVATSRTVAASSGRLQKIEALASLLRRAEPHEIEILAGLLTGTPRQAPLGVAFSAIRSARSSPPVLQSQMSVTEVDAALDMVAAASGAGSSAAKSRALDTLFSRATADEQDFLARLLFGELRQGALEGVFLEAVARAAGIPSERIRRAAMLGGALGPIARDALVNPAALDTLAVRPFQPVQPMLAESVGEVGGALQELPDVSLEYKIDGARIQLHKAGDDVRVYSRNLRDVTAAVPEIVELARALPARDLIVDGEAVALRSDGTPRPFQVTMQRFGRKRNVEELRRTLPISPMLFDCLYLDGAPLIDEPLDRRASSLASVAPTNIVVPRIVPASAAEASAFFSRAIAAGHEGVMAKARSSTYSAGRRGRAWLKIKRVRTLDLVVLAVEWGSGRRQNTLSNLHLGARDLVPGRFVMLGKTFKGLTDEMLAWQTRRLLELETARDRHVVYVRPELVVEIAFNDVQESPQYPARLALRFARVKGYRTDKTAAEADSISAVQAIYREMTGLDPPVRAGV